MVRGSPPYSYDAFSNPYTYTDATARKNPANIAIMIGYSAPFQGVSATATHAARRDVDPQGCGPDWSYISPGPREYFRRGDNAGDISTWLRNEGCFVGVNYPFGSANHDATPTTVTTAILNQGRSWDVFWQGKTGKTYWTIPGGWAAGYAGLGVGVNFPYVAGDENLWWVWADNARTAMTYCKCAIYNAERDVTITAISVIP